MPESGVTDEIAAHRGLGSLPAVWADLAYGRITTDEALERARSHEPHALAERSARMLSPPSAEQRQARLRVLLGEHFTAEPAPAAPSTRWRYGVVALLAAAAAVLLVMPRLRPDPPPFAAGYELELERALAHERALESGGAEGEVPQYRADRTLELTLRPGHRVTEVIDVRAFATHADGRTIVLPIEPRTSPLGVVEILGQPRAWGLTAGRWRLTVVIGPAGGLPDAAAGVQTDADAPYDVQHAWIEILEEAPAGRR
jgi:hypothetical protein